MDSVVARAASPAKTVVFAGLLGGAALCGVTAYATLNWIFDVVGPLHATPPGCESPGFDVGRYYLPLAAWGPVVLAVTLDYRRRHRTCTTSTMIKEAQA
jgi:hypothetical protein